MQKYFAGMFNRDNKNVSETVRLIETLHPIHLYLIFEKSNWKNQVRKTGVLIYFELDFYCLCSQQKSISKLIFQTWFKNQLQMDRAKSGILQEFQSKFAFGFCGNKSCREKFQLIFSQIVWVGIDSTTPQYGNTGCRVFIRGD